MKVFMSVSCLLAVATVCTAHMCLLTPIQRGSMQGLNKAGADDCILLKAPCGDRDAAEGNTIYAPGSNYTVIFQKNLDHWAKATPGYFTINLMNDGGLIKEVAREPDAGEPSLHLYSAMMTVPVGIPKGNYALQVQYVTKNSQAPAVFYQCADVQVM